MGRSNIPEIWRQKHYQFMEMPKHPKPSYSYDVARNPVVGYVPLCRGTKHTMTIQVFSCHRQRLKRCLQAAQKYWLSFPSHKRFHQFGLVLWARAPQRGQVVTFGLDIMGSLIVFLARRGV